ncbi:FkbM family methyltransferase [Halorubrum amylolyticum]|uniref:FkbM family methyltransferase n=1 Tax=Halorubrum amylolyticum TaxID=2508724 RepID=UPI001008C517|nr:FkbM family methyltransferase [Halorubrum amylolyticum]
MGSVTSRLYRWGRHFVESFGLKPVVLPLYRWWGGLQYRLAGETYGVEVGSASARFHIPTRNEWTDFRTVKERPILDHLVSNLRRDDVFYDVGANLGLYSCLVADVVTRPVIAFEPHPGNADRLEDNADLNGADISVFRRALAESTGEADLTIALDKVGSAGHTLVSDWSPDLESITVPKIRSDELIAQEDLPRPTVFKIDVEGAEQAVLDGLEATLSRPDCRLVYCETHADRLEKQGSSVADIRATLESHGFSVTETPIREGKGESMLIGAKSNSTD